ncbi:MAG: type II toxin-antitoxin system VapC family toxin [Actinomycetales bacterium]|nr:type II toxin-antitoxin system VapC family toxin [Actinomycetales bacterium]
MLALDVNVLVAALHAGARDHARMRTWVEDAVNGPEPVGVSEAVASGVVRVLTHPRVFDPPARLDDALARMEAVLGHPNVTVLSPAPGHWAVFAELCRAADARGNLVADAAHAATALQHNATFVTRDRDYARFPGLRWRVP